MMTGRHVSENRRVSDGRPENLSADLQQETSLGRNLTLEGVILFIITTESRGFDQEIN